MTQTRRDPRFRAEFGERFGLLVSQHLKMKLSALAARLGYDNDTVLRKVCSGSACLSVEKLGELAAMTIEGTSARVSTDWLLTGHGTPLRDSQSSNSDPIAMRVELAPESTRRVIENFLDVQEGKTL